MSKNILRGINCEQIVRDHYLKKGYQLLHHRLRTKFAEADLIFLDQKGRLVIVEVKSWSKEDFLAYRLSFHQKNRLKRLLLSIIEHTGEAYAELAVVSQSGEVTVFEDVFG